MPNPPTTKPQKADLNRLAKALKGLDPQSYATLQTAARSLGKRGINPIVLVKIVAIACLEEPETTEYGRKLDRLATTIYLSESEAKS